MPTSPDELKEAYDVAVKTCRTFRYLCFPTEPKDLEVMTLALTVVCDNWDEVLSDFMGYLTTGYEVYSRKMPGIDSWSVAFSMLSDYITIRLKHVIGSEYEVVPRWLAEARAEVFVSCDNVDAETAEKIIRFNEWRRLRMPGAN